MIKQAHKFTGIYVPSEIDDGTAQKGCPPMEIVMAYLGGNKFSSLSGTKIDDIRTELDEHFSQCGECADFRDVLSTHASLKKFN